MSTAFTQGLWSQEQDKIIWSCAHCGERSEAGAKPFPRGLCPYCSSMELRKEMHEENQKVIVKWFCKVCQKLSTPKKKLEIPTTSAQ